MMFYQGSWLIKTKFTIFPFVAIITATTIRLWEKINRTKKSRF
ncbi:MAG: hypothetical protein UR78_C0007G0017 [Candidatus Moranbacteria bacterium GW2011_GWF2_35_39]|nr:MAG: hypothetical protein UR78_C0007G0017 [Candidatus Moranbacteria bacterium GW2011_GWF2_35_39]